VAAGRGIARPAFTFLAAFTYWPVLRVLCEWLMVGRFAGQQTLGLDNYRRLFADPHFARAAYNNAAYAFGTIVPRSLSAIMGFSDLIRQETRGPDRSLNAAISSSRTISAAPDSALSRRSATW
jgi:ABC-type sugar transport system permease subunit